MDALQVVRRIEGQILGLRFGSYERWAGMVEAVRLVWAALLAEEVH